MPPTRSRLVPLAGACLLAAFQAEAAVTPPPLPRGSHLVQVVPGMSEEERKRHVRAHHHKFHHKKDYTRDDSIHGHESAVAGPGGVPGGTGRAPLAGPQPAPVPGGTGTGPAREKTERGASSYFYGDEKK